MQSSQMVLSLDSLPCISSKVRAAIEQLALNTETDSRGAIFTRQEVVEFILDLSGYTEDQPLHEKRLLEPSFGGGDFLLPIIERLLNAWRVARPNGFALDELADAIWAVELHHDTFHGSHATVVALLERKGIAANRGRTSSRVTKGHFAVAG